MVLVSNEEICHLSNRLLTLYKYHHYANEEKHFSLLHATQINVSERDKDRVLNTQ